MGIIAACAPALRPGWIWLRNKSGRQISKEEAKELTDKAELWSHNGKTTKAHSENASYAIGAKTDKINVPPSLIQKTTRVDIDLEHGQ